MTTLITVTIKLKTKLLNEASAGNNIFYPDDANRILLKI